MHLLRKCGQMANEFKDIDARIAQIRQNVFKAAVAIKHKIEQSGFPFKPFSIKQKKVLTWWCKDSPVKDKDGIIADGAIRSGKTLCMSLSFVFWAMSCFKMQNFGMAGKTIGSFRRNVVFWLKLMLRSRGYHVADHRTDNMLEITSGEITNFFYVFGGKDERSQDLIQGITLAGMFFDEVALMPESFVNQATGRCSVTGSKFWFNCNPDSPEHWFNQNWILKSDEKRLIYLHFTMDDNLSLSEEIKARYKAMYQGVFYDRFIRGLWVLAAGLIFRYFAEDDSKFLFDDSDIFDDDGNLKVSFFKITMGIDFGGNGSQTTFNLSGFQNRYHDLKYLEEDELPVTEDIDAKAICDKFLEFYRMSLNKYGRVDWIWPDSASTTLINSLRSAAREAGLPYRNIKGCRKNEIKDRPITFDMLLNTERLKINRKLVKTRKAIANLRWDEKKPDQPEDKNIGNVNDRWDSSCYTWIDVVEWIDLKR